jgi:hypothetical protein
MTLTSTTEETAGKMRPELKKKQDGVVDTKYISICIEAA